MNQLFWHVAVGIRLILNFPPKKMTPYSASGVILVTSIWDTFPGGTYGHRMQHALTVLLCLCTYSYTQHIGSNMKCKVYQRLMHLVWHLMISTIIDAIVDSWTKSPLIHAYLITEAWIPRINPKYCNCCRSEANILSTGSFYINACHLFVVSCTLPTEFPINTWHIVRCCLICILHFLKNTLCSISCHQLNDFRSFNILKPLRIKQFSNELMYW